MAKVPRFQAFAASLLATAMVAAGLAAVPLALAQQLPHLAGTPDPDNPSPESQANERDQSVSTLKVNVNVVQLFFNVKDKKGGLIPNLTKNDFKVNEDGNPQTIKYFTAESDLPLTLGILIDSSGSQRQVLEMEKEVGANFLNEILRPKDLAFVISFDVESNLLQDFTNSPRLLRAALNSARINAPPSSCGGLPGQGGGPLPCGSNPKGTVLYDTVYLAAHDELAKEVGRKAMILLTDGEDQGSRVQDHRCDRGRAEVGLHLLRPADRRPRLLRLRGRRVLRRSRDEEAGGRNRRPRHRRRQQDGQTERRL